ncbi:MAG: pseudouridine synthase [Acidobacteriota bacterium]
MPPERIQKVLSRVGLASRREAEDWIREGRVSVNGQVASLGDRADPEKDAVKVDGKRIRPPAAERTYLLLNKPKGYVTTMSDPERRDTVMDLVPGTLRAGVRPVGRLDVGTEGLLLLTDDGDLARDVTHPSIGCAKEYSVKVSGVPSEKDLERLRRGIVLDGIRTRSCEIDPIRTTAGRGEGNAWFRVTLREGRSRQIRRMFEVIGHQVSKLKRVAIGPIRDEELPPGRLRRLTGAEVAALKASLAAGPKSGEKPPARSPRPGPRGGHERPRRADERRGAPEDGRAAVAAVAAVAPPRRPRAPARTR